MSLGDWMRLNVRRDSAPPAMFALVDDREAIMNLVRARSDTGNMVPYAPAFAETFLLQTSGPRKAVVYHEPTRLPLEVRASGPLPPGYDASQLAFYVGKERKDPGIEVTLAMGTIIDFTKIDFTKNGGNYVMKKSIHMHMMFNRGSPNLDFIRKLPDSLVPAPLHGDLSLIRRYGAALTNQEDAFGCIVVPFIREQSLVSIVRETVEGLLITLPDIRVAEGIFLH